MAIQGDLAQILSGMPIRVAECNIAISQPSIREISAYGEDTFLNGLQILIKTNQVVAAIKEGNSQLAMLSDFQILIATIEQDVFLRESINNFFTMIFPLYSWQFAPGSINFMNIDGDSKDIVGQINPMNFNSFQATLKTLFLPQGKDKDEEEYKPINDKAAEIAAKLKKGREQRAALKNQGKDNGAQSLFATYISILSVGLSMDINILYNYTPFQLYDIFKRYTTKLAYDLHMKVATTPFMDTSNMQEPTNWMDNIYS